MLLNLTNITNSYNYFVIAYLSISNLGLNKISINPTKVSKNTVINIHDYNKIIPIDTSSDFSDYSSIFNQPYVKISSNSSNWRYYFRTVTNKFQRIKLNKTYNLSNNYSIWSIVNGNKLNNLQRIEVLPSKIF